MKLIGIYLVYFFMINFVQKYIYIDKNDNKTSPKTFRIFLVTLSLGREQN